jgi:hypothetical protein
VDYQARLESVCSPKGYRGFESHPLRQPTPRRRLEINPTKFSDSKKLD